MSAFAWILWIAVAFAIGLGAALVQKRHARELAREPFQTPDVPVYEVPSPYAGATDNDLQTVMKAQKGDIYQVDLPAPFAAWALKTIRGSPASVRAAIFNNYESYWNQYMASASNPGAITYTQSCSELAALISRYNDTLTQLRQPVQDLSGNVYTLIGQRNDNMAKQKAVSQRCLANPTNPDCIALASMDDQIIGTIPYFDAVNNTLIDQDIDITERLVIVRNLYSFMKCPDPAPYQDNWLCGTRASGASGGKPCGTMSLPGVGYINASRLKNVLTEVSPYLLSPVSFNYVLNYVGNIDSLAREIQTIRTDVANIEKKASSLVR